MGGGLEEGEGEARQKIQCGVGGTDWFGGSDSSATAAV